MDNPAVPEVVRHETRLGRGVNDMVGPVDARVPGRGQGVGAWRRDVVGEVSGVGQAVNVAFECLGQNLE